MENVLLVPKLAVSLMSLRKLLTEGPCCEGKGKAKRVYNHSMTLFNFTM